MSKAHVGSLIEQLGKELEIPGLILDPDGYCCLFFGELAVNIEVDEEGLLFLYANIGRIPESEREAFYRKLLSANYFYQQTGGATIGIDADQSIVLLITQIPGQVLEIDSLRRVIENFINIGHSWMQRIAEFSPAPSGETEKPYPGVGPLPNMFA